MNQSVLNAVIQGHTRYLKMGAWQFCGGVFL